ncbi:uncharacterized protein LOC117114536 [Anneissia japonica]|uniref:uncharacterized protein LOC117114536 n=1 Tax=Anneissia japonica TaxID=1529436 RepID=UPI001425B213|nr:uncharacterized protein LOC117114536 [Anneissia japonica]
MTGPHHDQSFNYVIIFYYEAPCIEDDFKCHNELICVKPFLICDGVNQCRDFSDEYGCTYGACNEGFFRCSNGSSYGACIADSKECDRVVDCYDGADENDCVCKGTEYKCVSRGGCIDKTKVCDGNNDCTDKSDEKDCEVGDNIDECGADAFQCWDVNECINRLFLCDGYQDCKDGSDEDPMEVCQVPTTLAPTPTMYPRVCIEGQFQCDGVTCIPAYWKCDGFTDCTDETDEDNCNAAEEESSSQPYADDCPTNDFYCDYGYCIPISWVCDGAVDCEDSTDEEDCSPSTTPRQPVISVVGGDATMVLLATTKASVTTLAPQPAAVTTNLPTTTPMPTTLNMDNYREFYGQLVVNKINGVHVSYTTALAFPDSIAYVQYELLFNNLLRDEYAVLSPLIRVDVTGFSSGSLVVHYTLLLNISSHLTQKEIASVFSFPPTQITATVSNSGVIFEYIQVSMGIVALCQAGYLYCDDNSNCLPSDFWCDGICDCSDATDENSCDHSIECPVFVPTTMPPTEGIFTGTADHATTHQTSLIMPTTILPTTDGLTTLQPTTKYPTTLRMTTDGPTTMKLTTKGLTTMGQTTEDPTTMEPTTESQTTMGPTTEGRTTIGPTIEGQTTMRPTTKVLTTMGQTTEDPTTMEPTTERQTTMGPTTEGRKTMRPTTKVLTTMGPTTDFPTTMTQSTESHTTMEPSTEGPTTMRPTIRTHTTLGPTTEASTTIGSISESITTVDPTTKRLTTTSPSTTVPTTKGFTKMTGSSITTGMPLQNTSRPVEDRVYVGSFTATELNDEPLVYDTELNDTSSEVFRLTMQVFSTMLTEVYNSTPGFVNVTIDGFRAGSLIVDFFILIQTTNPISTKEQLVNAFQAVGGKLKTSDFTVSYSPDSLTIKEIDELIHEGSEYESGREGTDFPMYEDSESQPADESSNLPQSSDNTNGDSTAVNSIFTITFRISNLNGENVVPTEGLNDPNSEIFQEYSGIITEMLYEIYTGIPSFINAQVKGFIDEGVTVNGYLEFYPHEQISSSELKNVFRESGDGDGFIQTTSGSLVYMPNSLVVNEMDDGIHEGSEYESEREGTNLPPYEDSESQPGDEGSNLPQSSDNPNRESEREGTHFPPYEDSESEDEGSNLPQSSDNTNGDSTATNSIFTITFRIVNLNGEQVMPTEGLNDPNSEIFLEYSGILTEMCHLDRHLWHLPLRLFLNITTFNFSINGSYTCICTISNLTS